MQCDDFQQIADSYLSDELLIETNHEVIRHLESCSACRYELAGRRQLRYQLKKQFNEAPALNPPDSFAGSLRTQLKEQALGRAGIAIPRMAYVGIAAALLIAVGLGWFGVERWRSRQRDLAAWTDLTNKAIGDHRECALEHKLGATIIDLNEAARVYDRTYAKLADQEALRSSLPAGAELLDAHSCAFEGRRFAHLVIKYHAQLVSVVVAREESNNQAPKPLPGDIASAFSSGTSQLAAFQTASHAVFVVSSLNGSDNMSIARAVAPVLQRQISNAEQPLEAKLIKARRR